MNVGGALGAATTGRDGQPHRLNRAGEVPVQLAVVGDSRVRGQGRLQGGHALQRPRGRPVATKLYLGIGEDGVGANEVRGQPSGALGKTKPGFEVVAGQGEGSLADRRGEVARVAAQRGVERALGARVVGRIPGLARPLVVRVAEQRVAGRVRRVRLQGGLEAGDQRLGVPGGRLADRAGGGRGTRERTRMRSG